MAESFDLAKRLADKRRAQRAAKAARELAAEFRQSTPATLTDGIDSHMAAVVDTMLAEPKPRYSWLRKGETLQFEDSLWPHQKMAVMLTVRNKRTGTSTYNASDVGTGKTRVAASAAATMNFKRVLWLTEKNLVAPTVREIMDIGGMALPIGDNSRFWLNLPMPAETKTVFYVTNYHVMYRDAHLMTPGKAGPQWDCIIIDEASCLKGGASYKPSKIWLETKKLCVDLFPSPDTYKIFLSATPAENRPEEIWAPLHIFNPERFKHYNEFKKIFCLVDRNGDYIFKAEMLLNLLGGMCIRQTVQSIQQDFPDFRAASMDDPYWFRVQTIDLKIDPDSSTGRAYLDILNEGMADLDGTGDHVLKPRIYLETMLRLRQLLSAGPEFTYTKTSHKAMVKEAKFENIDDVLNFVNEPEWKKIVDKVTVKMDPPYTKHDAVEEEIARLQGLGEQVLVYSCFNQPLENLHKALTSLGVYTVGLLTGDTPQAKRDQMILDFQQGKLDVLLANKKAAAKGLNLQKCDNWPGGARFVLHLDRWWNPAIERQANGRLVRNNTKYPVTAIYFEVENSMDKLMRAIVEAKADRIEELDAGMIRDSMNRARLG